MDRVSSQLLRSAVASAIISAAVGLDSDEVDGAGPADVEMSADGGAAATDVDEVDEKALDAHNVIGWADLCSVWPSFHLCFSASFTYSLLRSYSSLHIRCETLGESAITS